MSVNIHGKEYRTVAERINLFYERYDKMHTQIITEIVKDDGNIVQVKATINVDRRDKEDSISLLGTGYAEEDRSKGRINSTSALENCETSAIGRALASIGLGGEEYASANEVENARYQQKQSTNGTTTKDDGSQFPQQQPKHNTDLTEALQNQVDKAKSQMNGESNGQAESSDNELDTSIDGVCMFPKYQGTKWSEVAKNDTWYITMIHKKNNLDDTTRTLVNHYFDQVA